MIGLIIFLIVLVIFIYAIVTYNNFIKLDNNINASFSAMDVMLKKRWDLVPNLVETVKGYANHEDATLKEIVNLRNNNIYDSMSNDEKIKINSKLGNDIDKILLLKESYPNLKANENFNNLSNTLSKLENDIAEARKMYNECVRQYNDKVQMFPSSIIANLFGYKMKLMFETNQSTKENVKIEL